MKLSKRDDSSNGESSRQVSNQNYHTKLVWLECCQHELSSPRWISDQEIVFEKKKIVIKWDSQLQTSASPHPRIVGLYVVHHLTPLSSPPKTLEYYSSHVEDLIGRSEIQQETGASFKF